MKSIIKTHDELGPKSVAITASINNADTLRAQLYKECDAMARYILNRGLKISAATFAELDRLKHISLDENNLETTLASMSSNDVKNLSETHQALARAVFPATPRSLKLLSDEQDKKTFFYFLGPVPLLRWLSFLSIFFLIAMITVGLSDRVNSDMINKGLLNSSNKDLFLNQMFLLCCAGLGASFANLFQASQFIIKNTYDPQYDSTYWSRMIMGLMSGIIMVELLPKELFLDNESLKGFGKPAFAMLGGFSANLVYKILRRLVDTVESLFKADADTTEYEQQAKRAEQSEHKVLADIHVARQLVDIKDLLDKGASPEELQQKLNTHLKHTLAQTNT